MFAWAKRAASEWASAANRKEKPEELRVSAIKETLKF
jgi:hypothetical protein